MSNNSSSNNSPPIRLLPQPVREVSEEEWASWKFDPVTVALFAYLRGRVEEMKQAWVEGRFTHQSAEGTAQLNAKAMGACDTISQILDLDFEALNNGVRND